VNLRQLADHLEKVLVVLSIAIWTSLLLYADTIEMPTYAQYGRILKIDAQNRTITFRAGCGDNGPIRSVQWNALLREDNDKAVSISFGPPCAEREGNPRHGDTAGRERKLECTTITGYRIHFKDGRVVWPRGSVDMEDDTTDVPIPTRGWYRGPTASIRSIEIATVCEGENKSDALPPEFRFWQRF
jgi:hypothetical protein